MNSILAKYRNIVGCINYMLCLVMLFFASAPDATMRLLFNIWLISWGLEFRMFDKKCFSFPRANKSILLVLLIVLVEAISLLWSDNVSGGLQIISKHLYFGALALVFFFGVNERYNCKTMLYVFISGAVIVGSCYFIAMYYVFNKEALFDYHQSIPYVMPKITTMADVMHHYKLHQNLSLTLSLALISIPFAIKNLVRDVGKVYATVISTTASIIIFACIFFSGCRGSILALIVCAFLASIIRMKRKKKFTLSLSALVIVVLFSILMFHPRSKNVSFQVSKCITGKFEGNEEPRLLIWHGVYEICGETLFFGSGLATSRDRLDKFYVENNYPPYFHIGRLSPHSQYFTALLETGIFSVFLLIAMFVLFPCFYDGKTKYMALSFSTLFGIQCLTDAMLNICTGTIAFCIALLLCKILSDSTNKTQNEDVADKH